eukprot:Skav232922  [mRNA]  locus=scaffold1477:805550:813586:+ [translate_table: standard]
MSSSMSDLAAKTCEAHRPKVSLREADAAASGCFTVMTFIIPVGVSNRICRACGVKDKRISSSATMCTLAMFLSSRPLYSMSTFTGTG